VQGAKLEYLEKGCSFRSCYDLTSPPPKQVVPPFHNLLAVFPFAHDHVPIFYLVSKQHVGLLHNLLLTKLNSALACVTVTPWGSRWVPEPVQRRGRDHTYRNSGASNDLHSDNKPLDTQSALTGLGSNYGSCESCDGLYL